MVPKSQCHTRHSLSRQEEVGMPDLARPSASVMMMDRPSCRRNEQQQQGAHGKKAV